MTCTAVTGTCWPRQGWIRARDDAREKSVQCSDLGAEMLKHMWISHIYGCIYLCCVLVHFWYRKMYAQRKREVWMLFLVLRCTTRSVIMVILSVQGENWWPDWLQNVQCGLLLYFAFHWQSDISTHLSIKRLNFFLHDILTMKRQNVSQ